MWLLSCSGTGKKRYSAVEDLSSVIEADSIEQYLRRENMRIFDVDEGPGEDVFTKAVSVAEKVGVVIASNGVSTCHHLPRGGKVPKPIIAKFVRRDTKHQLVKKKRNLKTTDKYC